MGYSISGDTIIFNLETKHLDSLLKNGEPVSIYYNGHQKITILRFNKPSEDIFADDPYKKPSVIYNEINGEFKIMIHEDDIPQNSLRWLEITLPKSSKKIRTLKITCPLHYTQKLK